MSKTVIQMAKEAGFPFNKFGLLQSDDNCEIDADQMLERLVELARADERAKLAEQPAQQEPVGCLKSDPDEGHVFVPRIEGDWSMLGKDLYTTPQAQRKPLTDEQICDIWSWSMTAKAERTASTQQHAFARAIEAHHNIKENT